MKLNRDNAQNLVEALEPIIDGVGSELRDAAQGWLDLADETDRESRETKAEYREEWEGVIDEVEGLAIDLVMAFDYVAVPRKDAQKAGLVKAR